MKSMSSVSSHVMRGLLVEFRLVDLLQTVIAGPGCAAIELSCEDGTVEGTIWIRGGQVAGARRGSESGLAAFQHLMGTTASDRFEVSRLAGPPAGLVSIGSVTGLLLAISAGKPLPRPPATGLATGSQIEPLPPAAPMRTRRKVAITVALVGARAPRLARALARRGHRAILVSPERTEPRTPTIDDLLADADAIDEALEESSEGLRVLAVAPTPPGRRSVESEWVALLHRARARADVVVIDCAPGTARASADITAACTHVIELDERDAARPIDAVAAEIAVRIGLD